MGRLLSQRRPRHYLLARLESATATNRECHDLHSMSRHLRRKAAAHSNP